MLASMKAIAIEQSRRKKEKVPRSVGPPPSNSNRLLVLLVLLPEASTLSTLVTHASTEGPASDPSKNQVSAGVAIFELSGIHGEEIDLAPPTESGPTAPTREVLKGSLQHCRRERVAPAPSGGGSPFGFPSMTVADRW